MNWSIRSGEKGVPPNASPPEPRSGCSGHQCDSPRPHGPPRSGRRFSICRDPDDNLLLDVAQVGRARFLITNDRDLLEIPSEERGPFKFEIVFPVDFMEQWETDHKVSR